MKTLFYIICAIFVFQGMVIFTIRDFVSAEGKNIIQKTASYDALQNCETEDYRMVVLDNKDTGGKDVRYYSRKHDYYIYYRVKPDLSVEEVSVTRTAFLPDQYKGE
ncbi:hypothetical protein [Mitsuokella multacida]|uniref:hypothetical protein n=1 Tax=Mitsuokella multacida TaxID=52226 RepID=UPI00242F7B4A|nr:hypothetical protein [Mitsuokella multacida]